MNTQESNNTGIKVTYGKITVDEIKPHAYNDKFDQAQLRQIVTKTYPSSKIASSKSDNIFSLDEFGLEGGSTYEEQRVTWLDIPKGTTLEQVQAKLDAAPNARIQKQLSNDIMDILTDEQIYSINDAGKEYSLEDAMEKHAVRVDGKILQPVQYRQLFFKASAVADLDMRVSTDIVEAKKINEALSI